MPATVLGTVFERTVDGPPGYFLDYNWSGPPYFNGSGVWVSRMAYDPWSRDSLIGQAASFSGANAWRMTVVYDGPAMFPINTAYAQMVPVLGPGNPLSPTLLAPHPSPFTATPYTGQNQTLTVAFATSYVDADGAESFLSQRTFVPSSVALSDTITIESPDAQTGAAGWYLYLTANPTGSWNGSMFRYGGLVTLGSSMQFTGAQFADALAVTQIVWRGAWKASVQYEVNDAVGLGGVTYLCISPNMAVSPPDATYWQVWSAVGAIPSTPFWVQCGGGLNVSVNSPNPPDGMPWTSIIAPGHVWTSDLAGIPPAAYGQVVPGREINATTDMWRCSVQMQTAAIDSRYFYPDGGFGDWTPPYPYQRQVVDQSFDPIIDADYAFDATPSWHYSGGLPAGANSFRCRIDVIPIDPPPTWNYVWSVGVGARASGDSSPPAAWIGQTPFDNFPAMVGRGTYFTIDWPASYMVTPIPVYEHLDGDYLLTHWLQGGDTVGFAFKVVDFDHQSVPLPVHVTITPLRVHLVPTHQFTFKLEALHVTPAIYRAGGVQYA